MSTGYPQPPVYNSTYPQVIHTGSKKNPTLYSSIGLVSTDLGRHPSQSRSSSSRRSSLPLITVLDSQAVQECDSHRENYVLPLCSIMLANERSVSAFTLLLRCWFYGLMFMCTYMCMCEYLHGCVFWCEKCGFSPCLHCVFTVLGPGF